MQNKGTGPLLHIGMVFQGLALRSRYCHDPQVTDEETEAQRELPPTGLLTVMSWEG